MKKIVLVISFLLFGSSYALRGCYNVDKITFEKIEQLYDYDQGHPERIRNLFDLIFKATYNGDLALYQLLSHQFKFEFIRNLRIDHIKAVAEGIVTKKGKNSEDYFEIFSCLLKDYWWDEEELNNVYQWFLYAQNRVEQNFSPARYVLVLQRCVDLLVQTHGKSLYAKWLVSCVNDCLFEKQCVLDGDFLEEVKAKKILVAKRVDLNKKKVQLKKMHDSCSGDLSVIEGVVEGLEDLAIK